MRRWAGPVTLVGWLGWGSVDAGLHGAWWALGSLLVVTALAVAAAIERDRE